VEALLGLGGDPDAVVAGLLAEPLDVPGDRGRLLGVGDVGGELGFGQPPDDADLLPVDDDLGSGGEPCLVYSRNHNYTHTPSSQPGSLY
jgi:hypothetical protein